MNKPELEICDGCYEMFDADELESVEVARDEWQNLCSWCVNEPSQNEIDADHNSDYMRSVI